MGFASDSAVVPQGDGSYRTTIAPGWDIEGNANGGYLLALALRAMCDRAGRPDPVTVTGHFLARGRSGPAVATAEVVKEGRTFVTVTGRLDDAAGTPLVQVPGTFGDLSGRAGLERVDAAPPDLPPPDRCVAMDDPGRSPPAFNSQVEQRLHPDDAGFSVGEPSGQACVRGWFRLRDGEPIDTIGLVLAVDSFPPAIFNAHLPVGWTPTVELTAHIRARPEPGWLRCAFRTRFVTGGFLEEDSEVWDDRGRLVAQSRQLALVPRRA